MQNQNVSVKTYTVDVWNGSQWYTLQIEQGEYLRDHLRQNRLEPQGSEARIHCNGRGLCGTCAVSVEGNQPAAQNKIDELLMENGFRLSCMMPVNQDLTVYLA